MTGSIKRRVVSLALALTLVAVPAGTTRPGSRELRAPASIKSSVLYGLQGNVCSAIVIDCTDATARSLMRRNGAATAQIREQFGGDPVGRRALVHAAADSLAPPGTRGAKLPGGMRNIGDCINESTEEYENVSVYFDDNECRPSYNSARIAWKNQACASQGSLQLAFASLAQADLCGDQYSRLLEAQKDQAHSLNGDAAALEQIAPQIQDLKLRESLMQRVGLLRAYASNLAKAAEELTPK